MTHAMGVINTETRARHVGFTCTHSLTAAQEVRDTLAVAKSGVNSDDVK